MRGIKNDLNRFIMGPDGDDPLVITSETDGPSECVTTNLESIQESKKLVDAEIEKTRAEIKTQDELIAEMVKQEKQVGSGNVNGDNEKNVELRKKAQEDRQELTAELISLSLGKQHHAAVLAALRRCTTYFTNNSFSFFFICCDATA
jgi:hypothetical protein